MKYMFVIFLLYITLQYIFGSTDFKGYFKCTQSDQSTSPEEDGYTNDLDTATELVTSTPSCPTNMVYSLCACQHTCDEPETCIWTCCREMNACICPHSLFLNSNECVTKRECGCFLSSQDIIIPVNKTHATPTCDSVCHCKNGKLLSCDVIYCDAYSQCVQRSAFVDNNGKEIFEGKCVRIQDCQSILDAELWFGEDSYKVYPYGLPDVALEVYCKITSPNGTVSTMIQRKLAASPTFHLGWLLFKDGFGSPTDEFWIGNDNLHYLTAQSHYRLRINMETDVGKLYYATYDNFVVDDELNGYEVTLGNFNGTVDCTHNHQKFSTLDRDNDNHVHQNCAMRNRAGWWYDACDKAREVIEWSCFPKDESIALREMFIDRDSPSI